MLTTAAVLLLAMLLIAADTPIGRTLHRWIVVAPARGLARITPGVTLFFLLLACAASVLVWLIGHEAVRLIAIGLPDLLAMATMLEVTAYLDVIAAAVAITSTARLGAVRSRVVAWISTVARGRISRPSSRRTATRQTLANDDEPPRVLRIA